MKIIQQNLQSHKIKFYHYFQSKHLCTIGFRTNYYFDISHLFCVPNVHIKLQQLEEMYVAFP